MMSRKIFFDKISFVINDWKNTSFSFNHKNYVPGLEDINMTYGNGKEKKGIEINTCVLFVDIRNSVELTKEKYVSTMGKLYSVFTQCILLAAQNEGGYVRNIIGDRVMVVFPPDDCFKKSVDCAITINQICKMINAKFTNIEFKCGIGIDYGKLSVMKVGIEKKGPENDDNKGLVWVGYPANFASRLTDCANKEFTDILYSVTALFYEYHLIQDPLLGFRPSGWYLKTKKFTAEELASSLELKKNEKYFDSKSFINPQKIERIEQKYTYRKILISDKIYKEYIKLYPDSPEWRKESRSIKDIDYTVWGNNLQWDL